MQEQVLEHWKDVIGLHINKLLITEPQMMIWYTDIEKMASDSVIDKYSKDLARYEDSLLAGHYVEFKHTVAAKGINGEFIHTHNTTVLDKTRAMLQKPEAVLTTIHEGIHFGQARVMDRLPNMSQVEHWCLNSANNEEQRNVFGIKTFKNTYIRSKSPYHETDELRACHYKLQFVERQAREMTIEIGRAVNLDVSTKEQELQWATGLLKARYGCHNLDDTAFFQILDTAQMKIARQMDPANALEANMMYDMAALMHEQEAYLHKSELSKMMHQVQTSRHFDWDEKAQALQNAGFRYANVIPFQMAKDMSLEEIANLDQVTRDQSPLFMMYAIHEYGEAVAPYINQESFDTWYFAHNEHFSEDMIWEVADALGDKYNQIGLSGIACDEKTLISFADENGKLLNMNLQEFYDADNQAFGDLFRSAITPEEAEKMLSKSAAEAIEIIDVEPEDEIDISDKR